MMESSVSADRKYFAFFQLVATMSAFVTCLLFWCGPSTIRGFIIPLVIDAINLATIGTFTHVGEKIGEPLWAGPLPTYTNAAFSVVALIISVGTTTNVHRFPNTIGTSYATASCGSVYHAMLALTAAIRARAIAQIGARHFPLRATVTTADPRTMRTFVTTNAEYRPCADTFARKIDQWRRSCESAKTI